MPWIVLILSGAMEAVWATALARSEGLSRPAPSALFALALIASMAGLAYALRDLPVGTAYAVWVGIGAALTVSYAVIAAGESASVLKLVLVAVIVGAVIGLKLVG